MEHWWEKKKTIVPVDSTDWWTNGKIKHHLQQIQGMADLMEDAMWDMFDGFSEALNGISHGGFSWFSMVKFTGFDGVYVEYVMI